MDENLRYQRDKATVITIIKYLLILGVSAGIIFVSSRLLIIVMPFLIGFILAKASLHIANGLLKLGRLFKKLLAKRGKAAESLDQPYVPMVIKKTSERDKERHHLARVFFPSRTHKKSSMQTKVSVIVFAVLLSITLVLLVLGVVALISQIQKIASSTSFSPADVVNTITDWLRKFSEANGGFLKHDQLESITQYINDLATAIKSNLPNIAKDVLDVILSVAGNLPTAFFFIIVMIMSGFYFLTDPKMILEFLSRNLKSRTFRHKSIHLVNRLSTMLFRVLGGYTAIFLITFFESLLIYAIAGIQYALLLALVTAILDFLPVLGVSATFIPLIAFKIIEGDYKAVIILIVGLTLISIVRRIIEPPILGSAMKMHPMATLFAMIVGVALWGVAGFVLGPVVLLIITEIFRTFALDKKLREWSGRILTRFAE